MTRSIVAAVVLSVLSMANAHGQASDQVLDRIRQKGQISVGYREASVPFSFLDNNQKPVGYAFDICLKVVEAVKGKLAKPDLVTNLVPVNLTNQIPLVVNGTVDIVCGSAVNTIARQSQVDFSATYFITSTRLLVKNGSGIKELEDLDGKAIALPINTTPERRIKALIADKKLNVKIVPVRDNPEGFLAVSTGRADAFSTDDILLFGLRKSAPNPLDYEVVGRPLSFEPYGLMVQKNSTVFLTLVNATIARLIRSGEMQSLYKRWLGDLDVPLSPDLATAFKIEALEE